MYFLIINSIKMAKTMHRFVVYACVLGSLFCFLILCYLDFVKIRRHMDVFQSRLLK